MMIRQYVLTLAVIHREPETVPDLAVAQAMITDDEKGGTAMPIVGSAAVRAVGLVLDVIAANHRAGKVEFVDGMADGQNFAELQAAAIAENMAKAADPNAVRRIVVDHFAHARDEREELLKRADAVEAAMRCDVCGAPAGELHDPNCSRIVAQGERVSL